MHKEKIQLNKKQTINSENESLFNERKTHHKEDLYKNSHKNFNVMSHL